MSSCLDIVPCSGFLYTKNVLAEIVRAAIVSRTNFDDTGNVISSFLTALLREMSIYRHSVYENGLALRTESTLTTTCPAGMCNQDCARLIRATQFKGNRQRQSVVAGWFRRGMQKANRITANRSKLVNYLEWQWLLTKAFFGCEF